MNRRLSSLVCPTLLLVLLVVHPASGQLGTTVPNWPVPSSSGSHPRGALTTQGDITDPLPFIGVVPCRIVDTRGPSGTFGAPALTEGVVRNFPLPSGPCPGIPNNVSAYSLNITVTGTLGPGFIEIWPEGGAVPGVSTLNYVAGQTIANAAIVPAGTPSGSISVVAGVHGTQLVIDINGYFSGTPGNQPDAFLLTNDSSFMTMELMNTSTSCVGPCGLEVTTASGTAIAGNGATFGVLGTSSGGSNTAGVEGIDATGSPLGSGAEFFSSGVTGISESNIGVTGVSEGTAVYGVLLDNTGNIVAEGFLGLAGNPYGVYSHGSFGGTGAKYFIEPHPTDASRVIRYVCLEGPESGTYFRGSAQVVNRRAVINVPEDFRIVTDSEGLTVQLTPVGASASMYVVSEDLNQIVVESNRDVKFHYMVNGVRKAFKDHQPIAPGTEFMPRSPSERMPGYLTEEARQRLLANGTYNADGTVNMATAERVGWTKTWAEREQARQQASQDAAAKRTEEKAKQNPPAPQRQQ